MSLARVAREAPATNDPWQDVVNAARDTFDTLHKAVLNVAEVQTDDELANKVQQQAKTAGDALKSSITELTEEAKKNAGKFDGVYKSFTDKLTEVVTELQNKNKDLFNGDSKKFQVSHSKTMNQFVLLYAIRQHVSVPNK